MRTLFRLAAAFSLWVPLAVGQTDPRALLVTGYYEGCEVGKLPFFNPVVGWDLFWYAGFTGTRTVIGNIEGGNIWFGHKVFVRDPSATTGFTTYVNPAAGSLNELDYHATTVGHVLAGSGYVTDGTIAGDTYSGLGMASGASVISAGVAVEFSATDPGSFSTTTESVITPYKAFFQGVGLGAGVARPDVINSSWGGGDPTATSTEALAIDGLARQNPSVALVVSAGNGGSGAAVSFPGSCYNSIAVGSLGGSSYLQPSDFTSSGMVDFFIPGANGGTTLTGVRAAVDIAAPGEDFFLAAYLGASGTIGGAPSLAGLIHEPLPTNLYWTNMSGTSYSSPIVAGGISLLKDAAKAIMPGNLNALDTRVIKSVLMAGATKTLGWNNGQNAMNVTTQALDLNTGAGALNLAGAVEVYLGATRDVAGNGGGWIASAGWDSATIHLGNTLEYVFSAAFTQEMALTVALNWFSVREFSDTTLTGSDLAFSNLDLQVWSINGQGQFTAMVGESMTAYNNTEFLRFDSLAAGQYGLRVLFNGMVFDTTNAVTDESYGLAWSAVAIPEPGAALLLSGGLLIGLRRRGGGGNRKKGQTLCV
ncbi:MAG: S8 family serine peptidase, partial [Verrucomicrobiota bacterium]